MYMCMYMDMYSYAYVQVLLPRGATDRELLLHLGPGSHHEATRQITLGDVSRAQMYTEYTCMQMRCMHVYGVPNMAGGRRVGRFRG